MATTCKACGSPIPTIGKGGVRYLYCPHRAICQAEMVSREIENKKKYQLKATAKKRKQYKSLKQIDRAVVKTQKKRHCIICQAVITNGNYWFCETCHHRVSDEYFLDDRAEVRL